MLTLKQLCSTHVHISVTSFAINIYYLCPFCNNYAYSYFVQYNHIMEICLILIWFAIHMPGTMVEYIQITIWLIDPYSQTTI